MSCRVRAQQRRRSSASNDFGRRLYEWRKKNDFSQSEAALKLHISTRTLQEWDQSRAQARGLALRAIDQLIRI